MAKDTKKKAADDAPVGPPVPPRLRDTFITEILPQLASEFGIDNANALPRLEAIIININVGRHLENGKLPPNVKSTVLNTLETISGQKPIVILSRKSVSNFKLREGMESAAMVTLRRENMWYFLDRFINLATPRIKDFRGLKDTAFDRQGNYSVGLSEQGVFPEIDMAKTNFSHGMNINFVFSQSSPKMSKAVLEKLGMPFRKKEDRAA